MNRTLLPLLPLLAACGVTHLIGQNEDQQGAITCATTTCNGTTVCVDDVCVQPSSQCGGLAGLQCPSGQRCVDDPRDGCTYGQDPDCGGVCVTPPSDGGTTPTDGGTHTDGGTPQHCGGLPGLQCASGYVCVDDPTDNCDPAHGGADCIGICQLDPNIPEQCGGLTPFPNNCTTPGDICVDDPGHPSMMVDGAGVCIKKLLCSGLAGGVCPMGMTCVDDPSDGCDPTKGGADCNGQCVLTAASRCGSLLGSNCPAGLHCVDDPEDGCDWYHGADCPGLCVP
jgi:hypothetical protein